MLDHQQACLAHMHGQSVSSDRPLRYQCAYCEKMFHHRRDKVSCYIIYWCRVMWLSWFGGIIFHRVTSRVRHLLGGSAMTIKSVVMSQRHLPMSLLIICKF
jgi:hypothetical protein